MKDFGQKIQEEEQEEEFKEMHSEDISAVSTASDALTCKVSTVKAGYYEDKYLERMCMNISRAHCGYTKKSPMIHRGYYARVKVVGHYFNQFMNFCDGVCQLLVLGCGYDTLGLNSCEKYGSRLNVFEVDFHSVIQKKAYAIENDNHLNAPLFHHRSQKFSNDNHLVSAIEAHQYGYRIGGIRYITADLRDSSSVIDMLRLAEFDTSLPTFILTECVLVYMQKSLAEKLVCDISNFVQEAVWVSYDMTNPHDPYGRMMQHNLATAGIHVYGLTDYPTFQSLSDRFVNCQWDKCETHSMLKLYERLVDKDDRNRIIHLEIFDEIEEWNMLMNHYGLTIASKGDMLSSCI